MSDLILALILMIWGWALGAFINYFFKGNRMFKLQPKPTFWVKVPIAIAGAPKPALIDIEFKHLGRNSLRDYIASLDGREDAESLAEIVMGWKEVDEEFSQESLNKLLDNYPGAALSMVKTFVAEALEAKTKN